MIPGQARESARGRGPIPFVALSLWSLSFAWFPGVMGCERVKEPAQAATQQDSRGLPERRSALGDCNYPTSGRTPLPDLGAGTYVDQYGVSWQGGLYPDGSNACPAAHLNAGLARAASVKPLDSNGMDDPVGGKIVLLSLGMSNTNQEFDVFKSSAEADPAKNPRLVIINGAIESATNESWTALHDDPATPSTCEGWAWTMVDGIDGNERTRNCSMAGVDKLRQAGVTPQQVQVAWVKNTRGGTSTSIATNQADFEQIARNLRSVFPNLQLLYFSSRNYSYCQSCLASDPVAYEGGISVREMIARQINDPSSPAVGYANGVAPWLSWGPYLYADGMGRSDGYVWACEDVSSDGSHPEASGRQKIALQLLAFFKTAPTATPWFLKPSTGGPSVIASVSNSSPVAGPASPVSFTASVADPGSVVQYAWTFDDGTFALGPTVSKWFGGAGLHNVRVTVTDTLGNTSTAAVPVTVLASGGNHPPTAAFSVSSPGLPGFPALAAPAPLEVELDGSGSGDDSGIAGYAWDFGDGTQGSGVNVSHLYASPGTYTVRLTVTDDGSPALTHWAERTFVLCPVEGCAPVARFYATPSPASEGAQVSFDPMASEDADHGAESCIYDWDFGDGSLSLGNSRAAVFHTYTSAGTYPVRLTVTDPSGQTSSHTLSLTVQGAGTTTYFAPVADAYVRSDKPEDTFGGAVLLRANPGIFRSFLRFNVTGSGTVAQAKLWLKVRKQSATVHGVFTCVSGVQSCSSWEESTLSYGNAPSPGALIAEFIPPAAGQLVSIDVTSTIQAGGPVSLVLEYNAGGSTEFHSKESTDTAPYLEVLYD